MASTSGGDGGEAAGGVERESCVKHFDALWFCYSPVHQMREVYRYGNVDDCTGHWGQLYRCLKLRTKFREQVPQKQPANTLWQMRSQDEAAAFWQREFGHLATQSEEGGPRAGHSDAEHPATAGVP